MKFSAAAGAGEADAPAADEDDPAELTGELDELDELEHAASSSAPPTRSMAASVGRARRLESVVNIWPLLGEWELGRSPLSSWNDWVKG